MNKPTDTQLQAIVQQAIDLHVHIGPEVIPRRFTAATLAQQEAGKLAGVVLKNHFYATAPLACMAGESSLQLIGAVVLNWPVGGLNPEAVRAAALLSDEPIMVWLPTIHAQNFLNNSEYEIAPEWVGSADFVPRKSNQIKGISVLDAASAVNSETLAVLRSIKVNQAILATGHISARETEAVVEAAKQIGQKAIVITHPLYQRIAMSISQQKRLAQQGCFIEQCYSMYSIDKIPIATIAKQIRALGPNSIVLSSDVGQPFSLAPSEALTDFARLLVQAGIPLQWIETMMTTNPKILLTQAKE